MLTAVVALPILILLVVKGSVFLFGSFVVLLTLIGLEEFYLMALPERPLVRHGASIAGSLLIPAIAYSANEMLLPALALLVIIFALLSLFTFRDIKWAATEAAMIFCGFLYIPLLLSHLLLLRALTDGSLWILLLMVIVMSGDSAAYYVGSAIGKKKLYPVVSPKKSVEGALGGLVGSVIGALMAKATFFHGISCFDAVATALFLGVLGQCGDLFESLLKRSFGVKDSGAIFPGHGGVLDRLDSILFAAPAAYYYAVHMFKVL